MSEFRPVEGDYETPGANYAIVVSRWNAEITEPLLHGALRALARQGVDEGQVSVYRVPGAFELPLAVNSVGQRENIAAVIALGCVIRGDTPHFEYVCAECTRGIGEVSLRLQKPVAFGVLTTDTLEQAKLRSGDDRENKGEEAALTAMEMVSLLTKIEKE